MYQSCMLCPRRCGANRTKGQTGYCGADDQMRLGRAYLHQWEEPCLSGTRGAGTVFFCHCSLRCVFCQNAVISGSDAAQSGILVSVSELADTFLSLQEQGAHNIDLVTPTHYAPSIADAIALARTRGLTIPTVWNSSGYESVETLHCLDGLIDIYLPDFKYYSTYYAERYSAAPDYFDIACEAIDEMVRQTGLPQYNADGIMTRGTLIRHLILPGLTGESIALLDWIHDSLPAGVPVSLMRQYIPCNNVAIKGLDRPITPREYRRVRDHMLALGLPGFVQEKAAASAEFVPLFGRDESYV